MYLRNISPPTSTCQLFCILTVHEYCLSSQVLGTRLMNDTPRNLCAQGGTHTKLICFRSGSIRTSHCPLIPTTRMLLLFKQFTRAEYLIWCAVKRLNHGHEPVFIYITVLPLRHHYNRCSPRVRRLVRADDTRGGVVVALCRTGRYYS